MPVRKFRHVAEMEGTVWREPEDPERVAAIKAAWDFAQRTTRTSFPPGVYKHRTPAGAQALREQWEQENFRAFQHRKGSSGDC